MRTFLACALCALLLPACDQIRDQIPQDPEPVAFSRLTVTSAPLPDEEDGTAPDFFAEVQGVGGTTVYRGPVVEDADASAFPYTVVTNGALSGARRSYYVVVLDQDADGADVIVRSNPFTADDLRAAQGSFTITGENRNGTVEATITL